MGRGEIRSQSELATPYGPSLFHGSSNLYQNKLFEKRAELVSTSTYVISQCKYLNRPYISSIFGSASAEFSGNY